MQSSTQRPSREIPARAPRQPARRSEPEEPEIALINGVDAVPLTLDLLLHPSLDVQVPQSDDHSVQVQDLVERLKGFVERRPGWRLFSDLILIWPGVERHLSPDISIAENVPPRRPKKLRESLDVAEEGCRVRAVIEVVSRSKIQREKDRTQNPPLFARAGVDELVHVHPPALRRKGDPALRVWSLAGGVYQEQRPDPHGRFLLRTIGVHLGVERFGEDGERLIVRDAATGEKLLDKEESDAEREAADRRSAEFLISVLEQRGLELDADAHRRILECRDPAQLGDWMGRAFTVAAADELWA